MLAGSIPTLEDEIEKNRPHLKKEDIQVLREWKNEEKWLPTIEDSLLAVFLHSNYYNIPKTKKCIEEFYQLRFSTPEYFTGWDVNLADLQKGLKILNFAELGNHPKNGHKLIFHCIRDKDPKDYVFRSGVVLLFMTIESCVYLNGTYPGYEMVFSCQGVKFGHLTKVNLKFLKRFCHYVQEASPVRLKAIHVLHASSIMDKILFILKPFIKKELLDMIHLYPGEPDEKVWEKLPKSILPQEFGGELGCLDDLQDQNIKRLTELQGVFKQSEEIYLKQLEKNNSLKLKDIKKNNENSDFQNLEID